MAKRNYISTDFAAKLERARRKTQRTPQAHRPVPPPHSAPQDTSLFRVYNNGSETIPEFGVMQVEELSEQYGQFSGETKDAYSVIQPDGEGSLFLINAGGEIEAGHFGSGMFATEPCKVLIDPDAATPTFFDAFGPVSGEWHLGESGTGFVWIGLSDEEDDGTETAIFMLRATVDDAVQFRNDHASETMPAYGVGRIIGETDVGGVTTTLISKPDTNFTREYLINGPADVAAGATGFGYLMDGRKVRVLYNSSSGTPAVGVGWGPKPGQWSIERLYYGFTIFGNNDTTNLVTYAKAYPINLLKGKTSGAHSKNTSQSCNIFTGDAATDTTWVASMRNGYGDLLTTKEVTAVWVGNTWDIVAGDCST